MKKVLASMSKLVAGLFSIAVLALLMSLTYSALQRLFPESFANQMWGLVMFDIAAMCWALIFIFQSQSVGQYAAAGLGFIVAFLGTLGMVAAEVMLSGQTIANVDTSQIGRLMVYGFIIVTAVHAALVYIHHGTAPEIHEQINVGIARGEVVSQAIKDATHTIEAEKQELSRAIYFDIVSQVKRDLGLHPVEGTVFDRRKFNLDVNMPVDEEAQKAAAKAEAKALGMWDPTDPNDSPFERSRPEVHQALTQAAPGAPDNYGPLWKASTDITPTLDAYAWECQSCEGGNSPYTRECQWCGQPRTNGSPVTAFGDKPPTKEEDAKPEKTDAKLEYRPTREERK
jgi:hypothetical protein